MKLKIIILMLILLLIVGCLPQLEVYTTEEVDTMFNDKLTPIEERLNNLENKQLSAEDIRDMLDIGNNNYYDNETYELAIGCPNQADIDKWSDNWAIGDISDRQFDKILDKFNECNNE